MQLFVDPAQPPECDNGTIAGGWLAFDLFLFEFGHFAGWPLVAATAPLGCSLADLTVLTTFGNVLDDDPVQLPAGHANSCAAGVHSLKLWAFDINPVQPPWSSRSTSSAPSWRGGWFRYHFLLSLDSISAASASVSYQNPSAVAIGVKGVSLLRYPDEPPADKVSLYAAGGLSDSDVAFGTHFAMTFQA